MVKMNKDFSTLEALSWGRLEITTSRMFNVITSDGSVVKMMTNFQCTPYSISRDSTQKSFIDFCYQDFILLYGHSCLVIDQVYPWCSVAYF
jgi:hypothetical protein